ncbi:lytic transglycosylase domain-containing protein [Gangjinia marincola]|uniref:Lytic transglycosylase domain-containing protein n=1 Tax=Gangjinia marincola TaxID=578463 RepID=A0ABN1MG60_9FLAO
MKDIKAGIAFLLLALVVILSINAVQDAPTDENLNTKIINEYNVYALPLPDDPKFAGEDVPIENPDIKERLDRELLVNTYWQSNGLLMIKRAHKYFPIIEPILKKNGVPNDFKYLAVIESGLTQAVSPAGATGFWQIMKQTGKEYGLEINDNVDERYHITLATEVACKYLKESKERLGSWTLAAAAYNAGNYGISKRLKAQQVDDYYDLLLGEETGRYLFRILALKEILKDPKKYGFNYRQKDLYDKVPTSNFIVKESIEDLASWAKQQGINYKILKIHNPWLREPELKNASGKKYIIELPKQGFYAVGN